ncbi:MAG: DUF4129 domain-containing protein [Janthinobacterium lividum]
MAGGTTTGAAADASARLAEAHRALVADPAIQFTMGPVAPPPKPPAWVEALGRFLERLFAPVGRFLAWLLRLVPAGPWAAILLWTVLGLLGAALAWMIVVRLREGNWRWPRRRRLAAGAAEEPGEAWAPDAGTSRALLAEADALAGAGRFAEAAHLLLHRSVEDIARRRPTLVRPALTSRDLAAADAIPAGARTLFAGIAALVERSLFGGRPVGDGDWRQARAAYADFALSRSWSAR